MAEAQELILTSQVDGIIRIRPDFSRQMRNGEPRASSGSRPRRESRQDHRGLCPRRGWPMDRAPLAPKGKLSQPAQWLWSSGLWFNEANESRY